MDRSGGRVDADDVIRLDELDVGIRAERLQHLARAETTRAHAARAASADGLFLVGIHLELGAGPFDCAHVVSIAEEDLALDGFVAVNPDRGHARAVALALRPDSIRGKRDQSYQDRCGKPQRRAPSAHFVRSFRGQYLG